MVSDRQLKHWYDRYNIKWFDGQLPTHTLIYWEPLPDSEGITCPVFEVDHGLFSIKLDPSIKGNKAYWKLTLIHEMVHLKLWPKHPKHLHGKLFQHEMISLAQRNAFKDLW